MPSRIVRIGTRGSALATWQARWVASRLAEELTETRFELVTLSTRGDEHVGGFTGLEERGVFTSDVEQALLDGRVDVAVHSLKDLPVSGDGFPVASVPLRGDVGDVLVSRAGVRLAELDGRPRVGTSSPRRACLVRALRPEAEVVPVRGNVDTRVRHVDEGRYDAIVLAAAGLERLDLAHRVCERFDPKTFPPAPGQGALAIQVRGGVPDLESAVARTDDPVARRTTSAERWCLEALGGGCARPVGAHAVPERDTLRLWAFVGDVEGGTVLRAEVSGADPEEVGTSAAESLLAQGAEELLR